MFGFDLKESAREAKRILECAGTCAASLDSWRDVVRSYERAKGALISALSPETGRRIVEYVHDIPETERLECWQETLATVAREPIRSEEGHADECYSWGYNQPYFASFPSLHPSPSLLYPELEQFWRYASDADILAQKVESGSRLCALAPSIKEGMRLGRALYAILAYHGRQEKEASELCWRIEQEAQIKPRVGTIVVSANLFDILFCSEACTYSSCHSLDGCHCAGPQQYLHDAHTIVVYYFEEARRWKGLEVPRKTFRQMVYLDKNTGAAALQKTYGTMIPDGAREAIRREVACLLARLQAGEDRGEPKWFRKDAPEGWKDNVETGAELAYLDPTREFVSLTCGRRPCIALAQDVPCGSCGGSLDEKDKLICGECAGDHGRRTCCVCNARLHDEDCRTNENGDCHCDECYANNYTPCERCGCELGDDDRYSFEGRNGEDYCQRCYERHGSTCLHCECTFHDDDMDGAFCDSCAEDNVVCVQCDEVYDIGDTVESAEGESYCPDCAPEHDTAPEPAGTIAEYLDCPLLWAAISSNRKP